MVEKYTPGAQSQSLVLVSQALDCRRVLVVLYTTQMLKDNTLPRGPKRQILAFVKDQGEMAPEVIETSKSQPIILDHGTLTPMAASL